MFHDQLDPAAVRVHRRRWFPFQPRDVTMAPCGDIHFHPQSPVYRDDFAAESLSLQGFFIHELAHVWQAQRHGRWYLVLRRHPFCRYGYTLRAVKKLADYGLEQQAEIIRHAFLIRHGEYNGSAVERDAISAVVEAAMR